MSKRAAKSTVKIDPDVIEIIVNLHVIFCLGPNPYEKISAWLKTKNLNLGGCRPIDLINSGRVKKLLAFVEAAARLEEID